MTPEPLPDEPSKSIQINQYIQLVNQSDRFPDPAILNGYAQDTRDWVLRRVELEQEERHRFINKLADQDHHQKMTLLTERGRDNRHNRVVGLIMLLVLILPFTILICLGKTVTAFISLIPFAGGAIAAILYNEKLSKAASLQTKQKEQKETP